MATKNTYVGNKIKQLQLMAVLNTYTMVSIVNENGSEIGSPKIVGYKWNSLGHMELTDTVRFAAAANTKIRGIRLYEGQTVIHTHPVSVNIGNSNTIYAVTKLDVTI